MVQAKPTLIDLFAGCGGLSLGLEEAGFQPVYVNELNEDARSTYLRNRVDRFPELADPRRQSADIFSVTGDREVLGGLAGELRQAHGDIDLVVGGPPCQGYSGIGHRRTFSLDKADIPSNHLYREMAAFIRAIRPKLFMFENVKGLLSSRWTPVGRKGEIWDAVVHELAIDGYDIRPELVQAKYFGVPQNRPRVLLIGVRRDLGWTPRPDELGDGLLPPRADGSPDPVDLWGDLLDPDDEDVDATSEYLKDPQTGTQRWFRTLLDGSVAGAGAPLTEQEYSHHAPRIRDKFRFMLANGGQIRDEDRTAKFAQRVIPSRWGPGGPSITATSLPDDYVHFERPRVPTVREWARLQTFPDWYQFSGKRTTGGRRRAGDPSKGDWTREVPKYTQIGNAVPVWMARAVGVHLIDTFELARKVRLETVA